MFTRLARLATQKQSKEPRISSASRNTSPCISNMQLVARSPAVFVTLAHSQRIPPPPTTSKEMTAVLCKRGSKAVSTDVLSAVRGPQTWPRQMQSADTGSPPHSLHSQQTPA